MSKMNKMGYTQGNMSPTVEDYQRPESNYSQKNFNSTLEYVNRQDRFQGRETTDIKRQDYKGRYS